MAINNENRRRSTLGTMSGQRVLPVPDSTVGKFDRVHAFVYRGIEISGPEGLTNQGFTDIGVYKATHHMLLAELTSGAAPGTPPPGVSRIYTVEVGGKQSLRIKYPGGAENTIDTEP